MFLYYCKSTSIAIYSQDEVVTCISGGIMHDLHNLNFSNYAVGVYLAITKVCKLTGERPFAFQK